MHVIMRKQVHIVAVTFAALVPLLMAVAITAVTPSGKIVPYATDVKPAWEERGRSEYRRVVVSNTHRTWRYLSE